MHASSILTLALAAVCVVARPATLAKKQISGFPFSRMVAFGDNLSDNGNGSVAHGCAQKGDPTNKIYGYKTWTNGPVAVSYLSTLLGVPLTADYAYGHCNGGSLFGATVNNAYTQSTAHAPDAYQQVANYSSTNPTKAELAETLHFLWIGANDINLYHLNVDTTDNTGFAQSFSSQLIPVIQNLIDLGAGYIMVPNLYPKQLSPSSEFYAGSATQVQNLGLAIDQANAQIQTRINNHAAWKGKVMYYDVNSLMTRVWNNHASYGITHVGSEFCDGYSQADFQLCLVPGKQAKSFYWTQYLDMTTYVDSLIAADMRAALGNYFNVA